MKEFMSSKLIQQPKGLSVSVFGRTWADKRAGKVTYQVAGSKYMGNGNYVGTNGNNRFSEKIEAVTGFSPYQSN